MTRQINAAGCGLIQSFESCQLTVYPDVAGLATVGWGHRTNLPIGETITQDEADELFQQDTQVAADGIGRVIGVAPLTENQFSACGSLAFNIGVGAFNGSTLAKDIVTGNLDPVLTEFLRWNRSGGKVVSGLTRRRQAEAALWATPDGQ